MLKTEVRKFDVFAAQIFGEGPKFFRGICKSTPLPTYWPRCVEIPWLSVINADEIKKLAVKYNGLAFGGHNKNSC